MLARSFRYYVEGILAVFYGRRVLLFLRDNGLVIGSAAAAVAVIAVLIYSIRNRRGMEAAPLLESSGEEERSARRLPQSGNDAQISSGEN
jgi:hypothetical protein